MARIAGHYFADTPTGRVCDICGKTWLFVVSRREHRRPGQMGIACNGALTVAEVVQLTDEIERVWRTVGLSVEA